MKLTRPQRDALERLLRGPEHWCGGHRAGGSTGRMLDRMVKDGLVTRAPHYVTDSGRKALAFAASAGENDAK